MQVKSSFHTGLIQSYDDKHSLEQNIDLADKLTALLQGEDLMNFAQYLQSELFFKIEEIAEMAQRLMINKKCSQQLGTKIILLWLELRIYNLLSIEDDAQDKQKVREVFFAFQFKGSQLAILYRLCCKKTEKQQQAGIIDQLQNSHREYIKMIFSTESKPPELPDLPPSPEEKDKETQKQLIEYIEDYRQFPDCSLLKDIQKEIIHALIVKKSMQQDPRFVQDINELGNSNIEALEYKLKNLQYSLPIPFELEETFREIKMSQRSLEVLQSLKSNLFLIDVLQLQRLIDKNMLAKQMVKDKHAICVIGSPSCGKTTTILKFLDYQLCEGMIGGLTTLLPKNPLLKEHEGFTISPEPKSCTKHMNAALLPVKMYPNDAVKDQQRIIICDTPGFQKDSSVEVEIANRISIVNVLCEAKSVHVVVILPFQSILSQEMAGVISLGNVVCNMFCERVNMEDVLTILFNKVPENMIQQMPKQIAKKMTTSSPIEKKDPRLITFLRIVEDAANDPINYLDPFKNSYARVLQQKILKKQPITTPNKTIRCDFTHLTKRKVDIFLRGQVSKVKGLIHAKKFRQSAFHLQMLENLINILVDNDGVRQQYNDAIRYIQNYASIQIGNFENLMNQFLNLVNSKSLEQKWQQYRQRIFQLQCQFKSFHNLRLNISQRIAQIINASRNKLLASLNKQINTENIESIKLFCNLFDKRIVEKALSIINKKMLEICTDVKSKIRNNAFKQIRQQLNILERLTQLCLQIGPHHPDQLSKNLQLVKQAIVDAANKGQVYLNDHIIKQDSILSREIIKAANTCIELIEDIASLRFFDNAAWLQNQLENSFQKIEAKCRKIIASLLGTNFSIEGHQDDIFKRKEDELIKQKQEMEYLMSVKSIKQRVKEQYQYAKQTITRKLCDCKEKLYQSVLNLRNNKDDIIKILQSIKNAAQTIDGYSQIFSSSQQLKVLDFIQNEFAALIYGNRSVFKIPSFSLGQLNNETFLKIKNFYAEILSLANLNDMGRKVYEAINKLHKGFLQELKKPFCEFSRKHLWNIDEKENYRLVIYVLNELDNLCIYSRAIEGSIFQHDYMKVVQSKNSMIKSVNQILAVLKAEIDQFLQEDLANYSTALKTKEVIKTILLISQKPIVCNQLGKAKQKPFEVSLKMYQIAIRLDQIKEWLQRQAKSREVNLQRLQKILTSCIFYCEIEDLYKAKGQSNDKFGFKSLQIQSQRFLAQGIKQREEQCRRLIRNLNPTQINFKAVKRYYEELKELQGQRHIIIIQQMHVVQEKTIKDLQNLKKTIINGDFIRLAEIEMKEHLAVLDEAIELEMHLRKTYREEDAINNIRIKGYTAERIRSQIIDLLKKEFEQLYQLFQTYSLCAISEKLKVFSNLQRAIENFFGISEQHIGGKQGIKSSNRKNQASFQQKNKEKIISFICASRDRIVEMIERLKLDRQLLSQLSTQTLSKSFDIVYYKLSQLVRPYFEIGESFNVDSGFTIYYSHTNEVKKRQLQYMVNQNLDILAKSYAQTYKHSRKQNANNLEEKITNIISLLPSELKHQHSKSFDQLKQALIKDNTEERRQLSSRIIESPFTISKFFDRANTARKNGQIDLHKQYIRTLVQVYTERQQADLPLKELIRFVENSFISVYHTDRHHLSQDSQMHQQFKAKFKSWLEKIQKVTISLFKTLQEIVMKISNQINIPDFDIKEIVSNAFKVHSLICIAKKSEPGLFDLCNVFIKDFDQILTDILKRCKDVQQKQPETKLNSINILQKDRLKELQNYNKDVVLVNSIIATIKESMTQNFQKSLSQINLMIKNWQKVLSDYEAQVEEMLEFIRHFEFYSGSKRNFKQQQLEADLNRLRQYCIILQANQQLFIKFFIKEKSNIYTFQKLCKKLMCKFNMHTEKVKMQITEVFRNIDGDPAFRTNLYIQQISYIISKQNDFGSIPQDQIINKFNSVKQLLRKQFDESRRSCRSAFEYAKRLYDEYYVGWQIKNRDKQERIKKANNKSQEYIQKIKTKLQAQLKNERTKQNEQKFKNIHPDYQMNFNTSKNEAEFKRQKEIQAIQTQFIEKAKKSLEMLDQPILSLCIEILKLRKGLKQIFLQAKDYRPYLEQILNLLKTSPRLLKMVGKAIKSIPNDHSSIGQMLLQQKVFISLANERRTELTKAQDIEYVVKNLYFINSAQRRKPSQQIILKYRVFKEKYEGYKSKYQKSPFQTTIFQIVKQLKQNGQKEKNIFYMNASPKIQQNQKVELLAGIFAVWSIINADEFQDGIQYTIDPHPAQITTLFLQLGMVNDQELLSNKLSQVGTGEGKSIILAGLSCYLALVGYQVRCACYSAYLSSRDQENFKKLFKILGVDHLIRYGTFNQICQDILNGKGGNFKEAVSSIILQNTTNYSSLLSHLQNIKPNPKILVIDEVDVFFDKNFFGESYCPAISLQGLQVSKFLMYVWEQVKKQGCNTDPLVLIKSEEFDKLIKCFPRLEKLLINQVNGMVAGALNFRHDYIISNQRIVYKDNDSLSHKITRGYKTVFANIQEHSKGKVSRANMEEALQISLMIAEFSYAMLPTYFKHILGVTGTLDVLPQCLKESLIKMYQIVEQHAIPSAFGLNNKRNQGYHLVATPNCNEIEIKQAIEAITRKKIIELIKDVKNNRPIIIFFKRANQLTEFFNIPEFSEFRSRTRLLTQQHDADTRDSRILSAVQPNIITLITKSFGRGTDFVVRNHQIKQNGGLHVIQAFLSLDESQEVQIKGRTARQNGMGSYDCIINQLDIYQLGLVYRNDFKAKIYQEFKQARRKKMQLLAEKTLKRLPEKDKNHKEVIQEYKKNSLNQVSVVDYIEKINKCLEFGKMRIKTVLGLDATYSMCQVLKKICLIIKKTFKRAHQVLEKYNVNANIEVKIIVYRNYDTFAGGIIQATDFRNNPLELEKFLNEVEPSGGIDNEALQVLFQMLNKEVKLHQVIVIGDAASNTEQQSKKYRNYHHRGDEYWVQNGFPLTSITRQLNIFKSKYKGCPVHSFQVNTPGNKIGTFFSNLSKQTGGKHNIFDVGDFDAATNQLTHFFVQKTLGIIERQYGNQQLGLVEAYKTLYLK